MKIFLPIFATVLLLSHSLVAQDQDTLEVDQAANQVDQTIDEVAEYVERNAEFGIRVGLNFSTLNDDEVFNPDSKTALHLGLFGRYLWSERLSGKVEVLYSTLGARSDRFYVFDDYSINMNYLNLIISGELAVTEGFRLEIGPYLGVLLAARQSFHDIDIASVGDGDERANSDETNFVDVGLMAGATYTFQSGFGLGLRYQQGFADALGNDFFRGASGSHSVFQISTLYTF